MTNNIPSNASPLEQDMLKEKQAILERKQHETLLRRKKRNTTQALKKIKKAKKKAKKINR